MRRIYEAQKKHYGFNDGACPVALKMILNNDVSLSEKEQYMENEIKSLEASKYNKFWAYKQLFEAVGKYANELGFSYHEGGEFDSDKYSLKYMYYKNKLIM